MAEQIRQHVPVTLRTERLFLRLADPNSDADCQSVVDIFSDPNGGKGGNSKVGIRTISDVRLKHRVIGPQAELCTLATPPAGMYFFMFLPSLADPTKADETDMLGFVVMQFRPEMPYPDIGYGIREQWQAKGYTPEAGRRVLQWWREEIGVLEIFCGTLPGNTRSQRCAEKMGFVRAGTLDIIFGDPPKEEERIKDAPCFVLPGMRWAEGRTIYPTIH